jgi:hypothetical protein
VASSPQIRSSKNGCKRCGLPHIMQTGKLGGTVMSSPKDADMQENSSAMYSLDSQKVTHVQLYRTSCLARQEVITSRTWPTKSLYPPVPCRVGNQDQQGSRPFKSFINFPSLLWKNKASTTSIKMESREEGKSCQTMHNNN